MGEELELEQGHEVRQGPGPVFVRVGQGEALRGRDPHTWLSLPSQQARPPQISRRDLARPNWQKSMATNWPQEEKPWLCRSAFVSFTAFSKSSREKSWRIWLNTLMNRFTVEPPFGL
jgi:hypothetical protein